MGSSLMASLLGSAATSESIPKSWRSSLPVVDRRSPAAGGKTATVERRREMASGREAGDSRGRRGWSPRQKYNAETVFARSRCECPMEWLRLHQAKEGGILLEG